MRTINVEQVVAYPSSTITLGYLWNEHDNYGPQVSAAEAMRMVEVERAQRIASDQRVDVLEERMDQLIGMQTRTQIQIDQLMTLMQRFTDGGQLSVSSKPVSNHPNRRCKPGHVYLLP